MATHKPKTFYVTIKNLLHFGELGVPFGESRINEQGEIERQFIMLNCKHGEHKVWLTRKDI